MPRFSRNILFSRAVLVCFLLVISCKTDSEKSIKTETIAFTKEGQLTISEAENETILAQLDIEFAESEYEIQTGLMYRNTMKKNQGMLFVFPNNDVRSFYMKNTNIPLDIIYINSEFKIVSFQKNAKPLDETSLNSRLPAKYVLEINAGLSDTWGLSEGDIVAFTRD
ncbi:MAG: DUF192 domain-containing protein [Bacteroidota bacterium]